MGIPSPSRQRLFYWGILWCQFGLDTPQVWNRHLAPPNAVNCGIRGDNTQNVMWRIEHMYLPATVSVGVIHCGINDINAASSHENVPHKIAGSKLNF